MLELFKKKIYEPNSSCVIKCVNKIDKIIEALEGEGGGEKKKMYITKRMFTFSSILSPYSYSNLDIEMLSVILICFVYL